MRTEGAGGTTVLVVDATGRGHAICDLFVRTDPSVTVFYAGSDAIEQPRIAVVPGITWHDPRTALAFLAAHPVDFVFVSNIDALSRGYVDVLRAHGQRVIGPVAAAARAGVQQGARRSASAPTTASRPRPTAASPISRRPSLRSRAAVRLRGQGRRPVRRQRRRDRLRDGRRSGGGAGRAGSRGRTGLPRAGRAALVRDRDLGLRAARRSEPPALPDRAGFQASLRATTAG